MEKEIISGKKVFFRYERDQPLLEGVSFSIKKGDFVGIIGANGWGKSTLLKLILNFIQPQKGEINLPPEDKKKYSIWYIPQFSEINQDFPISVRDVVASWLLYWWNFWNKRDEKKIDKVIKKLRLEKIENQLISEISGWERQRALIARALIKNPDIIIADEPTSNIDIHKEKEIFSLFQELHKAGKTLIIVSHDIFLLKEYATVIFGVNKHLHIHQPQDITEKLIYENYICNECKKPHE